MALGPDVILASGTSAAGPLLQSRYADCIPIVFTIVGDPVGAGLVDSLGTTGRQCDGLHDVLHTTLSGQWLELLKEMVPRAEAFSGTCAIPLLIAGVGQCERDSGRVAIVWNGMSTALNIRSARRFRSASLRHLHAGLEWRV